MMKTPKRLTPLICLISFIAVLAAPAAPVYAAPAAASAPTPGAASSNDYRLGSGDVVRISVFQNPELTLETRVSESGVVSYPLLGNIKIGGLAASQAEKLIADGLRSGNFVKQPQVAVLVVQVRGNQVSVLGQVNRPGRFPIEVSDMRLSDVLASAGGVAPTGADFVTVVGSRGGAPYRVEVDLPKVFASSNRAGDIVLQNGDVVFVERTPMIFIYGEVQRPGTMRLERGMTVLQALAAGGGLTQRGTEKGMRIHRKNPEGKVQVLQLAMDDALRDGDVVYVRESLF